MLVDPSGDKSSYLIFFVLIIFLSPLFKILIVISSFSGSMKNLNRGISKACAIDFIVFKEGLAFPFSIWLSIEEEISHFSATSFNSNPFSILILLIMAPTFISLSIFNPFLF